MNPTKEQLSNSRLTRDEAWQLHVIASGAAIDSGVTRRHITNPPTTPGAERVVADALNKIMTEAKVSRDHAVEALASVVAMRENPEGRPAPPTKSDFADMHSDASASQRVHAAAQFRRQELPGCAFADVLRDLEESAAD